MTTDKKGKATEHLLLRDTWLPVEQFTDAFGENVVVGHRAILGTTRAVGSRLINCRTRGQRQSKRVTAMQSPKGRERQMFVGGLFHRWPEVKHRSTWLRH